MKIKQNIVLVAIIIGFVILAGFYFSPKNDYLSTENSPIKIGAILPLSGIGAHWGEFSKNAMNMAVEEINNSGGVEGRMIEISYEDSMTDSKTGVSAFKKLSEVDRVDLIVGDVWAFLTNPLIPLAEQHQKILISPTVMDASVSGESDYFFTMGHSTESIKNALQTFFDTHPEIKTVAIICDSSPWGVAMTKAYEEVVQINHKEIIEKNCTSGFNPDYKTEAAKTKVTNPDAVLINGVAYRAVKVLKELGVSVPIVTDSQLIDGFQNSGLIELADLENVYVIDWHANKDFTNRFISKYGNFPIVESQNSYELIRSIASAYRENPTDILDGLRHVKYEGVEGVVDFSGGDNIRVNQGQAGLYKIIGKGNYQKI